jgi:hypothetical protein
MLPLSLDALIGKEVVVEAEVEVVEGVREERVEWRGGAGRDEG